MRKLRNDHFILFENVTGGKMIRVRILKSRKISCLLEASLFLLLALVAITINQKMIRDGVIFESYDIRYHINWLQHFSKQFSEGILYPRWLAGDNYGYGSPTFVFYPPLVYYLGSLLKISGLNAEQTIITLFRWLFLQRVLVSTFLAVAVGEKLPL